MSRATLNGTPGEERWRLAVLLAGPLLLGLALLATGPVAQDPAYHQFADRRPWLGIPSALNVLSNLAFLVAALPGLRRALALTASPARPAWIAFFLGTLLVAPGSGWYHLEPTDQSLAWDRLPMTVGFMGLTVAVLTERVSPALGRWLLPALLAGLASVGLWVVTGDLRAYAFVQFAPVLVVVPALALYPPPATAGPSEGRWILAALGCYGLAKWAEWADHGVYAATGMVVSGHTVKHLVAALGVACLWRLLRQRV